MLFLNRIRRGWSKVQGDTTRAFVRDGNLQMMITALLFMLGFLTKCSPVVEQPVQSLLGKVQPIANVFKYCEVHRTVTFLGAFGGSFRKPVQLWHVSLAYSELKRRVPHCQEKLAVRGVTKKGKKSFRGHKHNLKASQEYPTDFRQDEPVFVQLVVGAVGVVNVNDFRKSAVQS